MQYDLFSQPKYKFFSLGSGSSGNCYYFGSKECGVLLDAGIGIRTIKKALREYGVSFESIQGILITHDHADHIKTVGCLGVKHNIPVYATEAVHRGIRRSKYLMTDLAQSRRIIFKETTFNIHNLQITAFDIPHDSIENVGYHIEFDGQTFVLATDIGRITDRIYDFAKTANHLVIETNYDETMLQNGRYPYYLKQRISSGNGHISNRLSAQFIAEIYSEKMKNIWLCHLSQDNNYPQLAYDEVKNALSSKGVKVGIDIRLEALSRYKTSGLREF